MIAAIRLPGFKSRPSHSNQQVRRHPRHRLRLLGVLVIPQQPARLRVLVLAQARLGAIEGNHIDMFVDDADVDPFPDLVFSKASKTFEAYVVDKSNPAVIALHDAAEEICKDSDRPGRKRKKPANAI